MAERTELLTKIAYLYYKEDFTQQQIAEQLGLSRSRVTRLLQEARQIGLVRIEIAQPLPSEQEESHNLQKLFNLQRAVVVRSETSQEGTLSVLRRALASLIATQLKQCRSIGFSFSQTIGNIADYLHIESASYNGAVCDLMGVMMGFPSPFTASAEVIKRVGGTFYPISAPIMVLEANDIDVYYTDPNIKKSMEIARNIELAVVGIGDFTTQNILYRSGYINEETIENLRKQGIVGEMCMRFFDINGQQVQSEFDSRIISVPWESLASANLTVVASGGHKIYPLLGALRTGIVNTLVTDLETAQKILTLHR